MIQGETPHYPNPDPTTGPEYNLRSNSSMTESRISGAEEPRACHYNKGMHCTVNKNDEAGTIYEKTDGHDG